MADITIPNAFTDGAPIGSTAFNQNLFNRVGTPASASVLQGKLDEANIDFSSFPQGITRRHIYRYADFYVSSSAKYVDYPKVLFTDDAQRTGAHIPVLGTGIRFYLRKANMKVLLITWCNVLCDTFLASQATEIPMLLNGNKQSFTLNPLPVSCSGAGSSDILEPYYHTRQFQLHRYRSDLAKGWHTLSLGVYSQANMIRFRHRGSAVIALP